MWQLLSVLVQLFIYVIFAHAVLSFLFAFNIVDPRQPFVARIWQALSQILEPFYKPIRKFLPPMSGMDFTPMVLLLIIFVLRSVLHI